MAIPISSVVRHFSYVHIPKDGERGPQGPQGDPGSPGTPGPAGPLMPFPRLWSSYSDGYNFDDGTNGKIDVVLTEDSFGNLMPWECILPHPKAGDKAPKSGSRYWKTYDNGIWDLVATRLLLAQSAVIQMLNAQGILVGENGTVCGYFGAPWNGYILFTGGSEPSSAKTSIDLEGVIITGNRAGQRVVLNPLTMRMEVYNKDNEQRILITGEDMSVGDAVPSGGLVTGSAYSDSSNSPTAIKAHTYTPPTTVVPARTVDNPTTVVVHIPKVTLTASSTLSVKASSTSQQDKVYMPLEVTLEIGYGSTVIASVSVSAMPDEPSDSTVGTMTRTTSPFDATFELSRGQTFSVWARVRRRLPEAPPTASYSVRTTGAFSADIVSRETKSAHAGNGLAVSRDSQNWIYALIDWDINLKRDIARFAVQNPVCGLRADGDGLRQWHTACGWSRMGVVLFAGRVEFADTAQAEKDALCNNFPTSGTVRTYRVKPNGSMRETHLTCDAWRTIGTEFNQDRVTVEFNQIAGTPRPHAYFINTPGSGDITLRRESPGWAFVVVRFW